MAIRVVRLGSPRQEGEGIRIGTVRRPPRGVRKDRYAAENWYDVWLPNLAPSAALVTTGRAADDDRAWKGFVRAYEREMARPENARVLDTLAALSHRTNFSVGCYCENESRCHRSVLRRLLAIHGADLAPPVSPAEDKRGQTRV
ncbi:MAG TPA: DUF488 family protein [Vicinamibacterales bacterium]|nr:DUF488 family protein [Vicinamibacterales bacterium]